MPPCNSYIIAVDVLPKARLQISLSTGRAFAVDVSEYFDALGYARLRKPAFFAKVTVAEWGHGVSWPNDIVIPIEALYRMSREQAGKAWPTQCFNTWMKRHGLSVRQVSGLLGLPIRTALRYHTGAKPIPLVIGLACEGWTHRQMKADSIHG